MAPAEALGSGRRARPAELLAAHEPNRQAALAARGADALLAKIVKDDHGPPEGAGMLPPLPPPLRGGEEAAAVDSPRAQRQSRLAMGRAARAASQMRESGVVTLRSVNGQEEKVGPSPMLDQFRVAIGNVSSTVEMPAEMAGDSAVEAQLNNAERSALDAAIAERTKALNQLFEEQVKKQYELMRREVSKLAQQHQRDVHSLEQRFRQKMAGLASRFQALQEDENKTQQAIKESLELRAEVNKLMQQIAVQEEREKGLERTIAEKENSIVGLEGTITTLAERTVEYEQKLAERQASMGEIQAKLEATIATLQQQLDKKKSDLSTMQARLLSAKETFDNEVAKKQKEVNDLEASLHHLEGYTGKMQGFVDQIQEQIKQREMDMKTQLAMMKNTIAFALYIDETLQIDLTDSQTTEVFQQPVLVIPSGVTYSAQTVERIQREAEAAGTTPICPVSGEPITAVVNNTAIESILSRYMFKQQITKDVMESLHNFQLQSGMGEEDQPLEKYLQGIKASMADRLHKVHADQLAKAEQDHATVVKGKEYHIEKQEKAITSLSSQLEAAKNEIKASQKRHLQQMSQLEAQLLEARTALSNKTQVLESTRIERDALMLEKSKLMNEVAKLERADDDDDDDGASDAPTTARQQRKQELIQVRKQLEGCQAELEHVRSQNSTAQKVNAQKEETISELKSKLAGLERLNQEMEEEVQKITVKLRFQQRESAQQTEMVDTLKERLNKAKEAEDMLTFEASRLNGVLRDHQMQLSKLQGEAEKQRSRLARKDEILETQEKDMAALRSRVDEMMIEVVQKDRAATEARDEAFEATKTISELRQGISALEAERDYQAKQIEQLQQEVSEKVEDCVKLHATVSALNRKMDEYGLGPPKEGPLLGDMEAHRKYAGVYAPLHDLPDVPVLATLQKALGDQSRDLQQLAMDRINGMKSTVDYSSLIELRLPDEIEGATNVQGGTGGSSSKGEHAGGSSSTQ